jgi:hypothetical protein
MTDRTDDDQPPEDDYDVGYGRPPKHSQFQPGKSGNPKGRKRKPKSTQDQMRTILSKRITISEGGQSKRLTLQEVMLRSIANKAAKGDLRAANFVLNLINSDDAARSETIDQTTLSAEDQILFEQMMTELGADGDSTETESETPDQQTLANQELSNNET